MDDFQSIGVNDTKAIKHLDYTFSIVGTMPKGVENPTLEEYIPTRFDKEACPNMRFGKDQVFSHCGGVYTQIGGENAVVTAAHCLITNSKVLKNTSIMREEELQRSCDLIKLQRMNRDGSVRDVYDCEAIVAFGFKLNADLAIIKLKPGNSQLPVDPPRFIEAELQENQKLMGVGFPLGVGPKYNEGKYLSASDGVIFADMASLNKFSDSPVFTDSGDIAGIVHGRDMQNLTFESGNKDFMLDEKEGCFDYRVYSDRPKLKLFNLYLCGQKHWKNDSLPVAVSYLKEINSSSET